MIRFLIEILGGSLGSLYEAVVQQSALQSALFALQEAYADAKPIARNGLPLAAPNRMHTRLCPIHRPVRLAWSAMRLSEGWKIISKNQPERYLT